MTQAAGISVCMGNGSERLKQLCDRIAPTVYEDGLAREFAAWPDRMKNNSRQLFLRNCLLFCYVR